jgi:nitronate monooxygenase
MQMANILEKPGIENPIFLAPITGGPSTPDLIAAVCGAGGLGSVAGRRARQMIEELRAGRD